MGNVLSCKIYTVVSDAKRKHKLPRIYDGHTRSSNLSNIHEVSFSSPFPFIQRICTLIFELFPFDAILSTFVQIITNNTFEATFA